MPVTRRGRCRDELKRLIEVAALTSTAVRWGLTLVVGVLLATGSVMTVLGLVTHPDGHRDVRAVALRADGRQAVVRESKRLVVHDLPAGTVRYERSGTVWNFGFAPDGSIFLVALAEGPRRFSLLRIDPTNGDQVRGPYASRAAWSTASQRWIVAGEGRYLEPIVPRIRQCTPDFARCSELGAALPPGEGRPFARYAHLAVSDDGRLFSVATRDHAALHRDNKLVHTQLGERFIGAAFDAHAAMLLRVASGGVRHRLSILDTKRLEETAATPDSAGNVSAWYADFESQRVWVATEATGKSGALLTTYRLPSLALESQRIMPDHRAAVGIGATSQGLLVASRSGRLYRVNDNGALVRYGNVFPPRHDLRMTIGAALLVGGLLTLRNLRRAAPCAPRHGAFRWRWCACAAAYAALRIGVALDDPLGMAAFVLLYVDVGLLAFMPALGVAMHFGRLSHRRGTWWTCTAIMLGASAFGYGFTVATAGSV